MIEIDELLNELSTSNRVRVLPAMGQPTFPPTARVPADVTAFYERCGGIVLIDEGSGAEEYRILSPGEHGNIGAAVAGDPVVEPPFDLWATIGLDDNGEFATIDPSARRNGWCYDVFHETHFLADYARIVAPTFTEFVRQLFRHGGAYWFAADHVSRHFDPASD